MKTLTSSLFVFLLLLASPLAVQAQWVCSSSHVSTVEFMPEVYVRRGDATVTETLDQHVPVADRAALTTQILDLAHGLRFYCTHQLRVSFDFNDDTDTYGVHISIRAPRDRCWEQVQTGVRIFHQDLDGSTTNRTPSGNTPAAAVADAAANGTAISTAALISCPGDPLPD